MNAEPNYSDKEYQVGVQAAFDAGMMLVRAYRHTKYKLSWSELFSRKTYLKLDWDQFVYKIADDPKEETGVVIDGMKLSTENCKQTGIQNPRLLREPKKFRFDERSDAQLAHIYRGETDVLRKIAILNQILGGVSNFYSNAGEPSDEQKLGCLEYEYLGNHGYITLPIDPSSIPEDPKETTCRETEEIVEANIETEEEKLPSCDYCGEYPGRWADYLKKLQSERDRLRQGLWDMTHNYRRSSVLAAHKLLKEIKP